MEQQKKISVIASDFDGTILRPGEQKVREAFFPLIRRLNQRGIAFVAASGRQYANLRHLMMPVADQISYICENGALVARGDEIIYTSAMERPLAAELLTDMEKIAGTETVVSTPHTYYAVTDNQEFLHFLQDVMHVVVTQTDSYDRVKEEILKVSIWWKSGIPEEMEQKFHGAYDGRLQVVDGGNGWLDFNNLHTSKGTAIQILAEREHFLLEETVSFGDSENDVDMLQKTGYSYVMSTAREHVKQAGGELCEDVLPVMLHLAEK